MKKLIFLVIALLMVSWFSVQVHATLITVTFSGTIDSHFANPWVETGFNIGDTFSGQYTFESTTVGDPTDNTLGFLQQGGTAYVDALTSFFVTSQGNTLTSTGGFQNGIIVYDNIRNDEYVYDYSDGYFVVMASTASSSSTELYIDLRSTDTNLFTSQALPTSLPDLSNFNNSRFFRVRSGGSYAQGNLDSLQTQPAAEPDISTSPTSHGFGNVNIGNTSTQQTFTISNTGVADLVLGTIGLTGADASEFVILFEDCAGLTIAPSGTCTIDVIFSPTSSGAKSANLSIPSNDPDTPVLNVPLSGKGKPYPGSGGGGGNKESNCIDGEDNDNDGLTDCEDRDCRKDPACSDGGGGNKEINCTDGEDNDNDGLTDCEDRDCRKDPACTN